MLGKKNSYWEEKECLETVKALCAQPAAWTWTTGYSIEVK